MEQIFEEFKRGLKQLKGKILDTILADLKKEQSQFGDLLNSLNQLRVSAWHGVHIGDLNRENVMAYFPYTINALKYGNSLQILINKLNEMGIKLDDEDGQLFVINGDTGQTLAPVSEFTKCFDIQLTDDFDLMQILEMYSYAKDNNSSCLRSKSLELALIRDRFIFKKYKIYCRGT